MSEDDDTYDDYVEDDCQFSDDNMTGVIELEKDRNSKQRVEDYLEERNLRRTLDDYL